MIAAAILSDPRGFVRKRDIYKYVETNFPWLSYPAVRAWRKSLAHPLTHYFAKCKPKHGPIDQCSGCWTLPTDDFTSARRSFCEYLAQPNSQIGVANFEMLTQKITQGISMTIRPQSAKEKTPQLEESHSSLKDDGSAVTNQEPVEEDTIDSGMMRPGLPITQLNKEQQRPPSIITIDHPAESTAQPTNRATPEVIDLVDDDDSDIEEITKDCTGPVLSSSKELRFLTEKAVKEKRLELACWSADTSGTVTPASDPRQRLLREVQEVGNQHKELDRQVSRKDVKQWAPSKWYADALIGISLLCFQNAASIKEIYTFLINEFPYYATIPEEFLKAVSLQLDDHPAFEKIEDNKAVTYRMRLHSLGEMINFIKEWMQNPVAAEGTRDIGLLNRILVDFKQPNVV